MTSGEAFAALSPIVGSGGLIGALLAFLGYRQQAKRGRPDPAPLTVAMASNSPIKSADVELVVNSLSLLASAMIRANLIAEYRIYQAEAKGGEVIPFAEWQDKRELAEAAAIFRAQKAQPSRS
jgi:hypothetical protein